MKLKRTVRAGMKDQRGDTMIEIAISAVVVLTLLFGVMEFGRAMYIYHFVSYAAQAGTRYALVRGNSWKTACASSTTGMDCQAALTDIQAYVQSIAPPRCLYIESSPDDYAQLAGDQPKRHHHLYGWYPRSGVCGSGDCHLSIQLHSAIHAWIAADAESNLATDYSEVSRAASRVLIRQSHSALRVLYDHPRH